MARRPQGEEGKSGPLRRPGTLGFVAGRLMPASLNRTSLPSSTSLLAQRGGLRAPPTCRYSAHGVHLPCPRHNRDDLGLLEHAASNLEPCDVVVLADGREAAVTARVEAEPGPGPLVAMLEVAIAPSRVEADDALP